MTHFPSLVRIMACRLFGTKPLYKSILIHYRQDPNGMTFNQYSINNLYVFIEDIALEVTMHYKRVSMMPTLLSLVTPQVVITDNHSDDRVGSMATLVFQCAMSSKSSCSLRVWLDRSHSGYYSVETYMSIAIGHQFNVHNVADLLVGRSDLLSDEHLTARTQGLVVQAQLHWRGIRLLRPGVLGAALQDLEVGTTMMKNTQKDILCACTTDPIHIYGRLLRSVTPITNRSQGWL